MGRWFCRHAKLQQFTGSLMFPFRFQKKAWEDSQRVAWSDTHGNSNGEAEDDTETTGSGRRQEHGMSAKESHRKEELAQQRGHVGFDNCLWGGLPSPLALSKSKAMVRTCLLSSGLCLYSFLHSSGPVCNGNECLFCATVYCFFVSPTQRQGFSL